MQSGGKSRGFSMIELIVVIALLGVVAAFAFPRFADLRGEARGAAMQGMVGSSRSAGALAHSLSITNNNGPNAPVIMEGQTITMVNGWPDAEGMLAASQLQSAGEFRIRRFGNVAVVVQSIDARSWTDCGFVYIRAFPPGIPTPRYYGPNTNRC